MNTVTNATLTAALRERARWANRPPHLLDQKEHRLGLSSHQELSQRLPMFYLFICPRFVHRSSILVPWQIPRYISESWKMLSSPNPDTKRWANLLAATPILTLTTTWNCCSRAPQESVAPSDISDRIQFSFPSDPIRTHFSESDIEVAGTSSGERRERDERVWEKSEGISKEEMSDKSQPSSSCRHLLWKQMKRTLLPLSHSVFAGARSPFGELCLLLISHALFLFQTSVWTSAPSRFLPYINEVCLATAVPTMGSKIIVRDASLFSSLSWPHTLAARWVVPAHDL